MKIFDKIKKSINKRKTESIKHELMLCESPSDVIKLHQAEKFDLPACLYEIAFHQSQSDQERSKVASLVPSSHVNEIFDTDLLKVLFVLNVENFKHFNLKHLRQILTNQKYNQFVMDLSDILDTQIASFSAFDELTKDLKEKKSYCTSLKFALLGYVQKDEYSNETNKTQEIEY